MIPPPSDTSAASAWQATVSGDAQLALSLTGAIRPALRMDFDFKGGKGFVVARRAMRRPMPAEYALRLRLRGRGPLNTVEFKLIDASGQNVWRSVKRDLALPLRWKRLTIESREIEFAWGPASGSAIAELGAIEIALVAGEGGAGSMWIDDLDILDRTPAHPPTARASSERPGFEAEKALDGAGWKPQAEDARPWIAVDAIAPRTFGGLIIEWLNGAPASGFRVRCSRSGRRWRTQYTALRAGGARSYVYLPQLKTRFVRVELAEPSAGAALRLQSFEFSRSIDAFWYHVADAEARGWHPRWLHREQSTWTPIGTSHGKHCALMNDDGMVEVDQGSFSLEPMLWVEGRLFTWADVAARQALEDDCWPVPSVHWETDAWSLSVRGEAAVSGAVRVGYRLENRGDAPLAARLFVLLRPFQVTPPWQRFRKLGGVSPLENLAWRDGALEVNGALVLTPASPPTKFGALRFDDGFMAAALLTGTLTTGTTLMSGTTLMAGATPSAGKTPSADATPSADSSLTDPFGFASGAFEFALALGARDSDERLIDCAPLAQPRASAAPSFDWRSKLALRQWQGNGWAAEAIRGAVTAGAHILVTRSGAALQPGPRRYTRSWIRDGAMMGAALLRLGCAAEVREFIDWYAPHQRADGFVPCCVDSEGIDWLVEHDSHGQLIVLIADYHRFDPDRAWLERSWPYIDRAAACIERLRGEDGLLPISVSHEGYLAQPVHSYWDDFWALKGLRDAAYAARALDREDAARRWDALSAEFAGALFASIEATRARRRLDFLPGSIEWADFDPTATANALYLLDVPAGLDRRALERTFEKYLADWRAKRGGVVAAASYTPYEIRIIGALVRLGMRDAALELLRFFLSDRRPPPWHQWPEIAWRDRKAPAHVGDLPHTWIAAEYVLAVRSLFAYERDADRALIVGAGLAREWIEGDGVRVCAMPTPYGALSYSMRGIDARTVRFEVGAGVRAKLIVRPPLAARLGAVLLNGRACETFDGESVTLETTPAEVICTTV